MKPILLAGVAALLLAFSMPSLADVGIRLHIGGILAETEHGVVTLGIGYSNYPYYGHYRGRHYLPRHSYHHRHYYHPRHYRPYRHGYYRYRYGKPYGLHPKHHRHFDKPRHRLHRQHRYPPSRSLRSHPGRDNRHHRH
ncbi:hypothetical protein [Marinobacterium arenosum]|uniref:hypothetical protein n=1 Tax=Marinobacterium arenosum TaxID=2862496 RepID=UPI001C968635|nr:hypothetical protein [Marinobacterium arenosum]MBY4675745.1 hypothetical protein [Marinobacterium arenosum]